MQSTLIIPTRAGIRRLRWLLPVVLLGVLGCLWLPFILMPTTHMVQRLHRLKALRTVFRQEPGLGGVMLMEARDGAISFAAPDTLPPADKTRLEHLVSRLAPGSSVSYYLEGDLSGDVMGP